MPVSRVSRWFFALAAFLATVTVTSTCGKDPTGPQVPAALQRMSGDGQSGIVGQALPNPLVVKVVDGAGAGVPGVSVAWSVTSGGGTVSTATTTTDALGAATVTWILGPASAANTVSASIAGVPTIAAVLFSATAIPGQATKLAFSVQPSAAVAGATLSPAVQVAVQDAQGNTVTTSTASVTLGITSGTGTSGAVLGGTLTRAAVSGVATFASLTIDKMGTGYTLTATAASLTSTTSTAFNVTSGADVEALIKGTFMTIFNGTLGTDGIAPSARTMSWENASGLQNFGMRPRSTIPRTFIDNSPGNALAAENYADFVALTRGLRDAANGVHWMSGATVQVGARAKAFGFFSVGVAMGYLSLVYDSAAIVLPSDDLALIRDLSSYAVVNSAALDALDSALAWTSTAKTMTGGYGTGTMFDVSWINGVTFTADDFTRLIRSYKAHFRANVARTPTERAAVLWTQVRDDAANGITADVVVTTGSPGWRIALNYIYQYGQWGEASSFIIGMADSSGAYDAWLAAPLVNQVAFVVVTADRRFPQGLTRAAQQANSPALPLTAVQYFRNRTTGDTPADQYGQSQYDFYRHQAWYNVSRIGANGPATLTKNQVDMLQAEARIRLGDIAGAIALIDPYRTRAGLPTLASGGITALGQAVPGGPNACVPRIPKGPAFTSAACGDIWEAMKWEFRMENYYQGYAAWYFPSRGWGDLPEGTPLHWPVPYQELDTRHHPYYNLGGVGMPGGAVGKGTYGY